MSTSGGPTEETSPARTPWLVLLCLLIVLAGLLWLLPSTQGIVLDTRGWMATQGEAVWLYFPESIRPLIVKGASVFLSPWLYLLMAAVFVAEKVLPADKRQGVFSVGMLQDFLGWFVIGGIFRVVLVGVLVKGLYWFCGSFLSGIRIEAVEAWPLVLVSVLAVLAGDFLNWLHHFIRHKIEVLWLFHTIHHSQEQMNMFTDLRVHLVEYLVAKPITILPLYILGLDLELAFWLTLVMESYSRVYHGNLRTNYGWLRYVLVTPQSHRIHHSSLPEHMDKNFAVIFSFWDRLFGTQWTGYDDYPPTGVGDAGFPHERTVGGWHIFTNYFRQLAYPFVALAKGRGGAGHQPNPTDEVDA